MSAVSVAMGVNLVFADYKASQGRATGSKVPDITCMTQNRAVRILGEIKTPWVNQHDLEAAIMIGGARFRRVFGQIAFYMRAAQLTYAFISIYRQTIFLKQEYRHGGWPLCHTPVIHFIARPQCLGKNCGQTSGVVGGTH
ncbi:hypothetical protein V8E54_014758 [Elaphomyces granulatus]